MNQKTQLQELRASDELNEEQIGLAKKQGETFHETLRNMTQKEAHRQQKSAGGYIIAWESEKAEGMPMLQDNHLGWQEPQAENTLLEVAVCDAADGRFIPGLQSMQPSLIS